MISYTVGCMKHDEKLELSVKMGWLGQIIKRGGIPVFVSTCFILGGNLVRSPYSRDESIVVSLLVVANSSTTNLVNS